MLNAAGDDHHNAGADNQQEQGGAPDLRQFAALSQRAETGAADNAANGGGHAPRKARHKLMVSGGILHPALLQTAPKKGIQIHIVQVTDAQQGVHLRKALASLPFADGLPG